MPYQGPPWLNEARRAGRLAVAAVGAAVGVGADSEAEVEANAAAAVEAEVGVGGLGLGRGLRLWLTLALGPGQGSGLRLRQGLGPRSTEVEEIAAGGVGGAAEAKGEAESEREGGARPPGHSRGFGGCPVPSRRAPRGLRREMVARLGMEQEDRVAGVRDEGCPLLSALDFVDSHAIVGGSRSPGHPDPDIRVSTRKRLIIAMQ